MSSLKDIMDVDVEPLESQAYRRSKEAAQQQASRAVTAPSPETPSPPVDLDDDDDDDDRKGKTPLRRRRSNRVSKPAAQPTAVARQNIARRRSSTAGESMDFSGFQHGGSNQPSTSGSPPQSSRGSEPAADMPVKYTPVTGRISRAKKGVPVHTCDVCRPVKTFTRAEHLRRHQLSHQKPAYPCTFEDCERAFHRPDLLARHLHRHETQGEKAYKSGDPRSRASSSASESRTPSLKVETPSLGLRAANQTSPTDSMTPRTSGSGESSMTASSFSTITTSFQAVNFSPGSGSSNKRSASQAQLPETNAYQPTSPGPGSRPSGNYGQTTNQNNYTRAAQSQFDTVYGEGGNTQFASYAATPQLPLLRIPEETYTPGLSYTQDNSPWCSSASDSTYSTQSDGPRNLPQWTHRGRSASIPDWPATTTHWSANTASITPQDLRAAPFESMLDQYETPYMSPRMTPPSRGHQLLDVPNGAFGGLYMESVGTPALSTYIKPLAQHFSASTSRVSDAGLASVTRRPKEMPLELFNIDTTIMSSLGSQPQLDAYVSSYWKYFHPLFPIIHRPTFDRTGDNLLRLAMAAIGTQYHDSYEARTKGSELNEACRKGIDLCLNWSTNTMQAILLTEFYTRFRGRKTVVRLSRHFEELYSRLLNDFDHGTAQTIQNFGDTTSADALIDRFGSQVQAEAQSNLDEHSSWRQWLNDETRRRLLSACFMFDVHQAMYHQQPRFKAPADESKIFVCLPAQDHVWNARNASEWMQFDDHHTQPLRLVEQDLSTRAIFNTSSFTQSLMICWLASDLPLRENSTHLKDLLPQMHPAVEKLTDIFPNSPQVHTYLAIYYTPLYDLLAIAGDTWVFAQKITPPSAFHDAQFRLKTWSTSLAAAQATHHACRVLSTALNQPWISFPGDRAYGPHCISDYWSIYVSALICWAFGHRYQNSGNANSGALSRSNSSTAIGAMDVDEAAISESAHLKAVKYANDILELGVEELLTSKAAVKCDTTGVIDAVRQRLEVESVGNRSSLLVDAVTVLTKIKDRGRRKWF
ncbi:hypothetical protein N431DRAFT_171451 [Stipitochalara longipes BDJ]|nr:hypothetical protein N431DRAFT_171451 [Stipitochalara longipes BDJ]